MFFNLFSFSQESYVGQWQTTDSTSLSLVEFTLDSIFIYSFDSSGCYESIVMSYTDPGLGNSLIINGSVPVNYSFVGDTFHLSIPLTASYNLMMYDFDITQYAACDSYGGSSNDSISYLDMWKTTSSTLRYVHFTNDSILIYQFDSTDCYTYSSLIYTDIGNNQLQIATLIFSTYLFSANGDSMSMSITGLGDLEMVRDSFDVSSWVVCTYNWTCNDNIGCEDVGNGNGMFNTESDCEASCPVSVGEYGLDVTIYPNPFSHYTTLSLSTNVVAYHLLDLTGRLIYSKTVENQIEYLHKNQLKSGVYLLQLVGDRGSRFERLIIE